jgi:hypothetical protein
MTPTFAAMSNLLSVFKMLPAPAGLKAKKEKVQQQTREASAGWT